ncbi:P-loop containing nucleoside triphosphate hydrolase protein [Chytriomyces sp. MP71]|nr:P-loop containing nucleoside triphosphate hydrolase protein [Chytriomyces sp. MP71]
MSTCGPVETVAKLLRGTFAQTKAMETRVLCLHGSRQTASIFRERLERFESSLAPELYTLVYVDGPITMEKQDGDSVALRTWFIRDRENDAGARCACATLAVLARIERTHGPFDALIGFSAGASAAVAALKANLFPTVVWTLLAGAPDSSYLHLRECCRAKTDQSIPDHIRSLHVMGMKDTLVSVHESKNTAALFAQPTYHIHEMGHSLVTRRADLDAYMAFISTAGAMAPQFILQHFGGLGGIQLISVKIPLNGTRLVGGCDAFHLSFRLSPLYPSVLPIVSTNHDMGMLEFPSSAESALVTAIESAMESLKGSAMLFDAVSTATQFLQDYTPEEPSALDIHSGDGQGSDFESVVDLEEIDESVGIISRGGAPTSLKSKNARGKWCHTIGLVGKPSAGKSTFFNAATKSLLAKMAAHPFTTIDPNVAQGFWKVPKKHMPSKWVEEKEDVLIPCVIKDVAGLVPGAWEGRGKGNKFLNDLCDADVLIHMVDASGLSDSDGNILPLDTPTPQDPLHDIQWVRNELFQWILSNITKKWETIVKRPSRLPLMFSGYRAPKWLVADVLAQANFDVTVSPQYAKQFWSLKKLEGVVDAFLDARFPMLLAMNKADLGPAARHISRMTDMFGGDSVIPVCAASEVWLQREFKAGNIHYETLNDGHGGSSIILSRKIACDGDKEEDEWMRAQNVVQMFQGTGVEAALTAAIMLRPPVFCYPVEDLDTLVSNGPAATFCLPMKPGSTVSDVFELLAHGSDAVLAGQFVRAEAMALNGGSKKPVKKETEIEDSCAILKLMSNRKSRWQHHERNQ